MRDLLDHTPCRGRVFPLYDLVQPCKTKPLYNQLMLDGSADHRAKVLNLYHCLFPILAQLRTPLPISHEGPPPRYDRAVEPKHQKSLSQRCGGLLTQSILSEHSVHPLMSSRRERYRRR